MHRTCRESSVANSLIRSASLTSSWGTADLLKVSILCGQQGSEDREAVGALLAPFCCTNPRARAFYEEPQNTIPEPMPAFGQGLALFLTLVHVLLWINPVKSLLPKWYAVGIIYTPTGSRAGCTKEGNL